MKKNKLTVLCAMILGLLMEAPQFIRAQMDMGQYEDEAPIQTWNTYGIQTAASLGRGGAGFTLAVDSSSSLLNPALLIQVFHLQYRCFHVCTEPDSRNFLGRLYRTFGKNRGLGSVTLSIQPRKLQPAGHERELHLWKPVVLHLEL